MVKDILNKDYRINMENIKNKVYLFHEINDSIMQIIKNISKNDPEAVLTFDDGLYSNYLYLNELKKLPNKKIFFISLGILRNNDKRPNKDFITCFDAHNQNDLNYYMCSNEINEIEDLDSKYNCFIGLHGVNHIKCSFKGPLINEINYPKISSGSSFKGLKLCSEIFKEEIEKMLIVSDILLNKKPGYFSWPYNIENNFMKNILIHKSNLLNFNLKFFGRERLEFNTSITIP